MQPDSSQSDADKRDLDQISGVNMPKTVSGTDGFLEPKWDREHHQQRPKPAVHSLIWSQLPLSAQLLFIGIHVVSRRQYFTGSQLINRCWHNTTHIQIWCCYCSKYWNNNSNKEKERKCNRCNSNKHLHKSADKVPFYIYIYISKQLQLLSHKLEYVHSTKPESFTKWRFLYCPKICWKCNPWLHKA